MTDKERIEVLEKENRLLKDTIKTLQDTLLSLSRQVHVHCWPPPLTILPVAPLQPTPFYPLPPPTYAPNIRPFSPMCFSSGSIPSGTLQGLN